MTDEQLIKDLWETEVTLHEWKTEPHRSGSLPRLYHLTFLEEPVYTWMEFAPCFRGQPPRAEFLAKIREAHLRSRYTGHALEDFHAWLIGHGLLREDFTWV